MTEYTPGPWTWTPYDKKLERLESLNGPTGEVCNFGCDTQYYPSCGEAPCLGDKRLIAAAPDMLAFIQEVASDTDGRASGGLIEKARAILAGLDLSQPAK